MVAGGLVTLRANGTAAEKYLKYWSTEEKVPLPLILHRLLFLQDWTTQTLTCVNESVSGGDIYQNTINRTTSS